MAAHVIGSRGRGPQLRGCSAGASNEWSHDNHQVMLEFDGGACGSGAVSAFGEAPGLQLRWIDPTTVEVQHAANVKIQRNASGEVIQCGGPRRRVRVVLKPV